MRARHLRIGLAIVCLVALAMAAAAGSAVATADDPTSTLRIEILDTDTAGLDTLLALAGVPHRAEVAVRITNTGTDIERNVVVRLQTSASSAMTTPVDLQPGDAATSISTVTLSGLPGASHEIVASDGTTTVSVTQGQAPWLFLGAAALGVHILALGAQDRLRVRVARAGAADRDQPSPSQTWARSSRYSETS